MIRPFRIEFSYFLFIWHSQYFCNTSLCTFVIPDSPFLYLKTEMGIMRRKGRAINIVLKMLDHKQTPQKI